MKLTHNIKMEDQNYLRYYYCHWVDTLAVGLFVLGPCRAGFTIVLRGV